MPSQRDVATYDLKPQMSAREVATAFEQAFAAEHPRFAVINFANADMVGHTGVIPAAIDGRGDGRRVPRHGSCRRSTRRAEPA